MTNLKGLSSPACRQAGRARRGSRISSGFTLIELLIVIGILGILATVISGNFLTSLKRGRDTRRKADVQQIQKAFELYYEDVTAYPVDTALDEDSLCHPDGCDTRNYMQVIPKDPTTGQAYAYVTDGNMTYYKLYSCLENTQDQGSGVDQDGWGPSCGACGACKFKIESSNAE